MSEPQAERHKLHWLPNALTVSRILLIPVLVWGILMPQHSYSIGMDVDLVIYLIPLVIFIYCMLTDFFDGLLARKLNIASDFGRMLDPIADKLLVAASLIAIMIIARGNAMVIIPSLMIIGRDIFVSGIREHAANSNIILSPTKLAKWKTTFEMIAILLFLCIFVFKLDLTLPDSGWVMYPPISNSSDFGAHSLTGFQSPNRYLGTAFLATLWLAAILSAYTGLHYFRSAMRKPE